jgi:hypothetical protein
MNLELSIRMQAKQNPRINHTSLCRRIILRQSRVSEWSRRLKKESYLVPENERRAHQAKIICDRPLSNFRLSKIMVSSLPLVIRITMHFSFKLRFGYILLIIAI